MRGFTALYNRCLDVASQNHPWLQNAHEGELALIDFSVLQTVLCDQTPAQVTDGGRESFEALNAQLGTLIGSELADRLLSSMTLEPLSEHLSTPFIHVRPYKKDSNIEAYVMPVDVESAKKELIKLESQILKNRWILHNLEQKIIELGKSWTSKQSDLLKANENLVVATCIAQTDTEQRNKDFTALTLACAVDSLTGLPNRLLFKDRLKLAIASAKRNASKFAILFLDLDNFKEVNDCFGHQIGDEVLQHVAKSLTLSVRAVDTVSRYGGDEFLILLPDIMKLSDGTAIAQKILNTIAIPFFLKDQKFMLSASIGMSVYPSDGQDADTLIDHADSAMYIAKKSEATHLAIYDNR
jgi:diguanylate cyclase (GGDEF)-like protein